MSSKKTNLTTILTYTGLGLLSIGFLSFQIQQPNQSIFIFLFLFSLVYFSVSELQSRQTAFILTFFISISLAIYAIFASNSYSQTYYLLSFSQVIFALYYFLISKLGQQKLIDMSTRERHLTTLMNNIHPLLLLDQSNNVLFANNSFRNLLTLKKTDIIDLNQLIHPADLPTYQQLLNQVILTPKKSESIDIRFKKAQGWIWMEFEAKNFLNKKNISSIIICLKDITLQKDKDLQKTELLKNEKNARAIAEKAVRDRDEFLSIASHELKTPLTTVILQLQVTLKKILTQSLADFSGKDLLSSLRIVEKQSQSLSTLIKDLLNVSLASTGRLTLNKEKTDLNELTQSLLHRYTEEVRLSGSLVKLMIKDPEVIGFWDPVRLDQALTNLFMNALKYAPGKKIILKVDKDQNFGIFQITDHGRGIPKDLQTVLFEPFKRGSNNSSTKGLGVGLFITHQIVTAHKGVIDVTSKLGKGTTFTIKLPLLKAHHSQLENIR